MERGWTGTVEGGPVGAACMSQPWPQPGAAGRNGDWRSVRNTRMKAGRGRMRQHHVVTWHGMSRMNFDGCSSRTGIPLSDATEPPGSPGSAETAVPGVPEGNFCPVGLAGSSMTSSITAAVFAPARRFISMSPSRTLRSADPARLPMREVLASWSRSKFRPGSDALISKPEQLLCEILGFQNLDLS
jgi:hypothetical protein